jgi:hypothetical protein
VRGAGIIFIFSLLPLCSHHFNHFFIFFIFRLQEEEREWSEMFDEASQVAGTVDEEGAVEDVLPPQLKEIVDGLLTECSTSSLRLQIIVSFSC